MPRFLGFATLFLLALSPLACSSSPPSHEGDSVTAIDSPLQYPSSHSAVRYQADRVLHDAAGTFVRVELLVRNLNYGKDVGVRASIDGGAWHDVPGAFSNMLGTDLETWTVELRPAGDWKRIEYAAYYRDLETGVSYWDNNGQHDYAIDSDAVVHRTGDSMDSGVLSIALDVRDLAFEKRCSALLTTDGWVHQAYFDGSYVGASDRPGLERWSVAIDTKTQAPWGLDWNSAVYEYAVTCQIAGTQSWDNANQNNYRYERVPQPDVAWQTAFDAAQEVAVAADGTTFARAGQRWISGYSLRGELQFSREARGDVVQMAWLGNAGILILQIADGAENAWQALGKDGSELWYTRSSLQYLVRQAGGEYLTGKAGGVRLSSNAPQLIGPQGGCDVSSDPTGVVQVPNVGESGLMACRTPAGKIETWNLDTGAHGSTLPGGHVFAVSKAGEVVVVSDDRTTMRCYSSSGKELWNRGGLTIAADTQYGYGSTCNNHAVGGEVVLYHRDPQSQAGSYIAGLDTVSGKERFHVAAPAYGMQPCAMADGNFHQTRADEHYGRSKTLITPAGNVSSYDIGMNGRVFDVLPDGRMLRRQWAYYPSDAGRVVLSDASQQEVFSASYSGSAGSVVAAVSGNRLVIASSGKLAQYLFLAP